MRGPGKSGDKENRTIVEKKRPNNPRKAKKGTGNGGGGEKEKVGESWSWKKSKKNTRNLTGRGENWSSVKSKKAGAKKKNNQKQQTKDLVWDFHYGIIKKLTTAEKRTLHRRPVGNGLRFSGFPQPKYNQTRWNTMGAHVGTGKRG